MRWQGVQEVQPRLASLGERLLGDAGVILIVTLRRDGLPRLSPVEPLFWRKDLWLPMMFGSRKARDLDNDPRVLVHNIVTSRDGREGEYKVRGQAVAELNVGIQRDFAHAAYAQLGWEPEIGRFHLFKVDISDITFIRYDPETGDQYVVRWPQGGEFVRRGATATSLGPPESHHEILAAE